jgi:hypothetical protein
LEQGNIFLRFLVFSFSLHGAVFVSQNSMAALSSAALSKAPGDAVGEEVSALGSPREAGG